MSRRAAEPLVLLAVALAITAVATLRVAALWHFSNTEVSAPLAGLGSRREALALDHCLELAIAAPTSYERGLEFCREHLPGPFPNCRNLLACQTALEVLPAHGS